MNQRIELLPCPFCGKQPTWGKHQSDELAFLRCVPCGITQPTQFSRQDAAKLWDARRPQEPKATLGRSAEVEDALAWLNGNPAYLTNSQINALKSYIVQLETRVAGDDKLLMPRDFALQAGYNLLRQFIRELQTDHINALSKAGKIAMVNEFMRDINTLMDAYGVEFVATENGNEYEKREAMYINLGDAYKTTLLFDIDEFEVLEISWGDWLEQATQPCRLFDDNAEAKVHPRLQQLFAEDAPQATQAGGQDASPLVRFVESITNVFGPYPELNGKQIVADAYKALRDYERFI